MSQPRAGLQRQLQAGFDALSRGAPLEAGELCRAVLEERPDLPRAHFLAARIALDCGDLDTAVHALETTVRLNDRHSAAWSQLAYLYAISGQLMRAEASLRNAAATDRGNAATRDRIGTVFRLVGNFDASREWHQKAVSADGENAAFRINLANSHIYSGDLDTARSLLQQVLAKDPGNALAHWRLSGLDTAGSAAHIDAMKAVLEDATDDRDAAYLHYAIGKEYEDLQDWPAAFRAWSQGAAARRTSIDYDEAAEIELFDTLRETFTTEWLEDNQGDCFDAGPVFIVGLPRTGTTLLDRMLAAHPAVTSAGELRHFGFAVREVTGKQERRQFSADLMRTAASADASAVGEAYLQSTASLRGDAAHVIDKLPSNFLYLPLILAALPNARVLHIRREPMDACLAIYKQLFADAYLYSYDLQELGRHYTRYRDLMSAWRERFGGRFFELDYEKLVSEPEATLRSTLQFIGLSWQPQCLEYFRESASSSTASAVQVREAPHRRSVGRWRHFERELQPLREIIGT